MINRFELLTDSSYIKIKSEIRNFIGHQFIEISFISKYFNRNKEN